MTSDNEMKAHSKMAASADSLDIRISVPEIARRMKSGCQAVYLMLEQGIIHAVRLGRRQIITRDACLAWQRCEADTSLDLDFGQAHLIAGGGGRP
jgi:hypothetical protein